VNYKESDHTFEVIGTDNLALLGKEIIGKLMATVSEGESEGEILDATFTLKYETNGPSFVAAAEGDLGIPPITCSEVDSAWRYPLRAIVAKE
jgi:hypothetical protein